MSICLRRRIGVLMPFDENDPVPKPGLSAFTQALADLGWTDGRNVRTDLRWAGGEFNRMRALAQDLIGLEPDIILTGAEAVTAAVQRETRIVFAGVTDPVALRIVARLNQPGGNVTGFADFEASMGGKWLELLSDIAPGLKRAQSCSIPTHHPRRLLCPHLRRRPGHSRSIKSLRPFIAMQKSKPLSLLLGASREAALSPCRMYT
jgi:putative ABC transport system substrate-binding protein